METYELAGENVIITKELTEDVEARYDADMEEIARIDGNISALNQQVQILEDARSAIESRVAVIEEAALLLKASRNTE